MQPEDGRADVEKRPDWHRHIIHKTTAELGGRSSPPIVPALRHWAKPILLKLPEQFVFPVVQLGGTVNLELVPNWFEFTLDADELGAVRIAVFFEPVGTDEARRIVV